MNFQAENAVSSFFYYMWNTWSQEECIIVYGNMSRHFWEKWYLLSGNGVFGAAERFYAELSDTYRRPLVERAVNLYDGKSLRNIQKRQQVMTGIDENMNIETVQ